MFVEIAKVGKQERPTVTSLDVAETFGKDAAQLRRDYGLGAKDNLRDAFPQEELAAVQSMERLVSGLVDCGWEYAQIKEFIGETNSRLAISA